MKELWKSGHRGAKGLVAHENTIESYQKAIEHEMDWIELDIHKTLDGVLVCNHDEHIKEEASIVISNYKYSELIQATKKYGYVIPTLQEVLDFCKNKIKLDIELKEHGYEEEVVKLVSATWNYDEFMMRSFIDNSILKIKQIDSNITTILLLGVGSPKHPIRTRLSELFPLRRIKRSKADIVSPYYKLLRFGYFIRMKCWRIPIIAWTVNDPLVMKKLIRKKVRGIITDYPDRLNTILKEGQND